MTAAPLAATSGLRMAWRAVLAFLLIAFLVATAYGSLLTRLFVPDVRVPVVLLGVLVTSPGWLILLLAARTRGTPWRWLAVAVAWGAFAAAFLAFAGEAILAPLIDQLMSALQPLGPAIVGEVPGTIAPIVEEPAKAIGTLIVLSAARRAGATLTAALGAAVGGLVGVAFGAAETGHHIAEVVANVGYYDLSNTFIIDWDGIWRLAQLQLVQKLVIVGLADHTLFSALAGVAVVMFLRGRPRAAVGWFLVALLAHGLHNSIGVAVGDWVFNATYGRPGTEHPGHAGALVLAWVAAAASFLVAQGWAAVLLVRRLRTPVRP